MVAEVKDPSKPSGGEEALSARIRASLKNIFPLPGQEGGDLVTRSLLSEIVFSEGKVFFSITLPSSGAEDSSQAKLWEPVRRQAEEVAESLPGVTKALVTLTFERPPAPRSVPSAPPPSLPRKGPPEKKSVPGVTVLIAVASGKGGVGKSTTACNLALGLQQHGLRVGLLDADIYGPSLPKLLNLRESPLLNAEKKMIPLKAYGLQVMSMGFLVEEERPVIWRGPMVVSALTQLLWGVAWEALDILVIDLPPGTGDIQLTLAQRVPLAGGIVVSTPQDLALLDARKGLGLFKRMDVPVLGIVENMSFFICPHCQERSDIFGHGGAQADAERLNVPFLGHVPLQMEIRSSSDAGTPLTALQPEGPVAQIYRGIATGVLAALQLSCGAKSLAEMTSSSEQKDSI